MTDRTLIEQQIGIHLDAGDLSAAATEAIRGYGRPILVFLAVVLDDEDTAKEVFSQFAEDLWRGIGGFRRESTLWTWAHTIARAAAHRHLRTPYRQRVRRLRTSEWSDLVEQTVSSSIAELAGQRERFAILREQLTPDERALLLLRVDEGLAWTEIAEIMSPPGRRLREVALRNRFQRLKQKLHDLAAEQEDA